MRQPELTSLVGLRDSAGDRLLLTRVDQPNGKRGYILRVGPGKVILTTGDLARLGAAIRLELVSANQIRFLTQVIGLLILCAVVWLFAADLTGPLFAYPWSN